MNCRKIRTWILQLTDEDGNLEEALTVQDHVQRCSRCHGFYQQTLRFTKFLEGLPEPPVNRINSEQFLLSVDQGLKNRVQQKTRQAFRPKTLLLTSTIAASLFVALGSWAIFRNAPEKSKRIASVPNPVLEEPILHQESETEQLLKVRAEIRQTLRDSMGFLLPNTTRNTVERSAVVFEEKMEARIRQGWPIVHIAGSFLDDQDEILVRATVRYLGVRPHSINCQLLKAKLSDSKLKLEVCYALGDLGNEGLPGLALALQDPELRAIALDRIVSLASPEAAKIVEQELSSPSSASTKAFTEELLLGLSNMGESGVLSLLSLSSKVEDEMLLRALEKCSSTRKVVIQTCALRKTNVDTRLLLKTIGKLRVHEAIPHVESLCLKSDSRKEALECLAKLNGIESLKSLMRLRETTRVEETQLVSILKTMLEEDPFPAQQLARQYIEKEDLEKARQFLGLLVQTKTNKACQSLSSFAMSSAFSSEERQKALLEIAIVGKESDAKPLILDLNSTGGRDLRLKATFLFTIYRLAGEESALQCMSSLDNASKTKIQSALKEINKSNFPATSISKLIQELQPLLTSKTIETRRSAL